MTSRVYYKLRYLKLTRMSSAETETQAPPIEIFDSLPYYDNDLEQYPLLKLKVEQELAREPKPPQTLHPRVPLAPKLFAVRPRSGPVDALLNILVISRIIRF
jgi:hypothetical protein